MSKLNIISRLCAACLFIICGSAKAEWYSEKAAIMGTEVSVRLWADTAENGQMLLSESMAIMREIDVNLSPYKSNSELSRVNREAARAPVYLSPTLYALVERAIHYSELSLGAFDITFASAGFLYDYRKGHKPSDAALANVQTAINYQSLVLNPVAQSLAFSNTKTKIDLGGIAKGYAVDRVCELLTTAGVEHAVVSAGGDSRFIGDRRGKPWLVGIQHPRKDDDMAVVLPMSDFAMSTSGDYERFYIDDSGVRIHHIINPRSGKPTDALGSVTVIGPHGEDTDALSTTVFVMGLERGMALLEQLDDFDGIIVDNKGQLHYSSGLQPPVASTKVEGGNDA